MAEGWPDRVWLVEESESQRSHVGYRTDQKDAEKFEERESYVSEAAANRQRDQLDKQVRELLERIDRLRGCSPSWRPYASKQLYAAADMVRKERGE